MMVYILGICDNCGAAKLDTQERDTEFYGGCTNRPSDMPCKCNAFENKHFINFKQVAVRKTVTVWGEPK